MTGKSHTALVAAASLLIACLVTASVADATLTTLEQACSRKLGRSSAKLNSKAIKAITKCRDADLAGKLVGPCPNADTNAKIAKSAAKLERTVDKSCGSTCSMNPSIACLADSFCPPDTFCPAGSVCPPATEISEVCGSDVGAADSFDIANMGFPGAFCTSIVGGAISSNSDLAACVEDVSLARADTFIDLVYGSIVNGSGTSASAKTCVSSVAKVAGKLTSTIVKGVGKCRDAIDRGKVLGDPDLCTVEDAKLASKIAKTTQKLRDMIAKKCGTAEIVQLDFCGNGVGGTADVTEAQDCLTAAASELADSSELPGDRLYSPVSVVEAAFPPRPQCGDNIVNQGATSTLPLGEECDGDDLGSCATGGCTPPGDPFQCSCEDTARAKLFVEYTPTNGTDTDAGWTGLSHDQKLAEGSGYFTTLENCDCSAFTNGTCTGTSSDPVCDANGAQLPVCSWEPGSATRCDDRGNTNGFDEDTDCWICDEASQDAGAACGSAADCQSQCFDSGGNPVGLCSQQSDCPAGQTCRGRCDMTQYCNVVFDGGPLPVNTAGTAVCAVQVYKEPVTGTRNIVTGEHELNYELLSHVYTAESNFRPCPVCGGFCVGGSNDLRVCEGRCSASGDPCRFDAECSLSQETCLEASPDCPGGTCELSLICGAKESDNPGLTGKPCSIDYTDPLYGTLSNDCSPAPGKLITGTGLRVEFLPSTHATQTLSSTVPCTSPGFELLDCPCPDGGGTGTKPSECVPACNAPGPDFGIGCAVGNTVAGDGTKCVGGVNVGLVCDEDGDCPGSTCSDNPSHCKGDPAFDRFTCSTNADCGLGTCEDACPGGRCLPLCIPDGADTEDGLCADGPPDYHCAGALFQFVSCNETAANADCTATCSNSGDPCLTLSDCGIGETCDGPCVLQRSCEAGDDGVMGTSDDQEGAGACIADVRSCFLDPIPAEGGATTNGKGDHTNWYSVGTYCFEGSISSVINNGAGIGGPGRTRRKGTTAVNVTSIP